MTQPVMSENEINQQAKILAQLPNGEYIEHHLPLVQDIYGNPYLITSNLYQETGISLYDEGLRSTATAESKITRIIPFVQTKNNSPQGILQYRGYNVKSLATACSFLETSYLLLHGNLPSNIEFKSFSEDITLHRILDKQTEKMIESYDRQTNPMVILIGTMSSLASRYESNYDMHKVEDRQALGHRLIAKMPTLCAYIHKHRIGQRPITPDDSLGHTANFLHMLLSNQSTTAEISQEHIKILDMILTLHADHQMAVSTFVARSVTSAGTPTISSIAAAIAALSGPLHGGANERVVDMLSDISDTQIDDIIAKAKDPNDPFKLFGFGHRVYKGMDPRASALREMTLTLLHDKKSSIEPDPMFDTALKLEEAALNDPYFIERNLFPNVDFYSGIALRALGIPKELFTVIFAMSRTSGWIAHIEESWQQKTALYRPKQYYTGVKERPLDWP